MTCAVGLTISRNVCNMVDMESIITQEPSMSANGTIFPLNGEVTEWNGGVSHVRTIEVGVHAASVRHAIAWASEYCVYGDGRNWRLAETPGEFPKL